MRSLWNFALNVIAVAIGLFLVVSLVPGVDIIPPETSAAFPGVGATNEATSTGTFIAVAIAFVIVNTLIAPVLRLIGAPITCLTLGLFALVINGAVLFIVAWLLDTLDLRVGNLRIDGWWPAIIGAAVLSIASGLVNALTSPLRAR